MNDAGRVANEVEIEQVVDAGFDWRTGFPLLASLVQVAIIRGTAYLACLEIGSMLPCQMSFQSLSACLL